MKIVTCISVVMALVMSFFAFYCYNESNIARVLEKTGEYRINLLQDQLRDYEIKISTTKTYEDGYRDALLKRLAGNYEDGFRDAVAHYKDGNYQDGYHNAIKQFGKTFLSKSEVDQVKLIQEEEKLSY